MQTKKKASDICCSKNGDSPLSSSAKDDGNKPDNTTQGRDNPNEKWVTQDSEEAPETSRAEEIKPQAEGFRGGKDARSSISQGSPASGSKEWAEENIDKGPKTHKTRYW